MRYVELRGHSAFSFGDGAVTPEALVERAAELGYGAVGLTDTADLGGIIRFALEAERQGIRPLIGAELHVDGHPAAFLVQSEEGYRNLASLVTRARIGHWGWWRKEGEEEGRGASMSDPATAAPPGGGNRGASRGTAMAEWDRTAGRDLAHVRGRAWSAESTQRREAGRVSSPPRHALVRRGHPSVTWDDVARHAPGLFALTGPASGELGLLLHQGRAREAARTLARWRELFEGRVAVEVQLHNVSGGEQALGAALIELARRERTPWVVSNDPRYTDAGSRLVHDLLTALRADVCVDTAASWGLLHPNGEWRLKGPGEMARLWKGREEGLAQSVRIAGSCAFDLGWLRPPLPRFPGHAGEDDDAFLARVTFEGAAHRWGELDERQRAQLEHELALIRRLGFAGFFLVMWDAVRFARERGILCQGRGSAANSAVAYCLGITAVDPVRHGLLFERFLSEVRTDGRAEAPDIDVDFEMERREEVLDYMYRAYDRRHSALTCTVLTYRAPAAIQDGMRALGYPAEQAFALSKRLHRHDPAEGADYVRDTLAEGFGLDIRGPRGRALLAAMRAMQDLPRMRSTHPGGFVLSREPLGSTIPIEGTTMGRTILQFDKDDLDAAGVPKFDFLGLGGLSLVHRAFDAIEARTGERLELYRLPVDDPKTYAMISRGETVGTFQIESRAQIASILQTRPSRLYDLVVQVALIRPGPIQARFVHPYTMRRRGLEPVVYRHPDLEPIVRRTYGIPIFQEQAMAISMALGGFSATEADELRRAMGNQKKLGRLKERLEALRLRMEGRGIAEDVARDIVTDLESFANYGFPESHAWSFALIAYATSYLKAHYPGEFLMAILNSWPMGFYPPATLVHDARRAGVPVLPPCLAAGGWECSMEEVAADHPAAASARAAWHAHEALIAEQEEREREREEEGRRPRDAGRRVAGLAAAHGAGTASLRAGAFPTPGSPPYPISAPAPGEAMAEAAAVPAVRIGWRFIRGLGEKSRAALQAAHARAPFTSVDDVVRRAGLSRAEALSLARAGAFEAFQPGRRSAAWEALRVAGDTLPLAPARALPFDARELEGDERIFLDYLATGVCTHGHPMEHIRPRLARAGVSHSADLTRLEGGEPVVVAGLVVVRQRPVSANGTVFLLLEDEHGFLNIVVPKQLVEPFREAVTFAPFVVVEGRFEREGRVMNVVGRRFRELDVRGLRVQSRNFR